MTRQIVPCEECGGVRDKRARRCRSCDGRYQTARRMTDERLRPRFDRFVDRSGGPDACWPWLGFRNRKGYGKFDGGPLGQYAPRVALALDGRPVEDGRQACHHCDNPPCVNPRHLYSGTQLDNSRDAVARGRTAHNRLPGELHPNSKLTATAVVAIRTQLAAGATQRQVATAFAVSQSAISSIARGRSWSA